jgi:hypothetical protein
VRRTFSLGGVQVAIPVSGNVDFKMELIYRRQLFAYY